jgi:uncharacterized protein (DUF1800 family)
MRRPVASLIPPVPLFRNRLQAAALAGLFLLSTPVAAAPSTGDTIRLLEQSTFGATPKLIEHVREVGFDAYLQEQFSAPASAPPQADPWPDRVPADCDATCRRDHYSMYPLQVRFFRNALTGQDQLRQRVAFALNQIFVTSALDGALRQPARMWPYLEILERQAFGNFRDLMKEVTLNPAMGRYLDMVGNKANAPNENYARELLQLFTVGLNQLNENGTEKRDAQGNAIPTYSQDTISDFARVFTGWVLAPAIATGTANYRDPMVPGVARNHDAGEKTLLRGKILAAGGTAESDLEAALDNIFADPNVAPFVSKQLIQHLVTSNPPPAYVARVARVFKRSQGDMKATVRAILLDPVARDATPPKSFGALREPVLWITQLLRSFEVDDTTTDFVLGESYLPADSRMGEDVYRAPSVFNFFPPDQTTPSGASLGPEFALSSTTAVYARSNLAYQLVYQKMPTTANRPKGTWIDLTRWQRLAADPRKLVKALDKLMMHGTMPAGMRATLLKQLRTIPQADSLGRVREAVYLTATSPQYQIAR